MRGFGVIGAACLLVVPLLGACTSLLGDFETGATSSDGGKGGDVALHDATSFEDSSEDSGEDSGDDGGLDAMMTSTVDNYVAPDHSAPPPGDAGKDAGPVHGNGTFQSVQDVPFVVGSDLGPGTGSAGPAPTGLIEADFNMDGVPDLAACTSAGIVVFLSKNGTFQQVETSDNSVSNCVSLAAFDQNNDGYLDLAVLTQGSSPTLYVFTNQDGVDFYIEASQSTAGPTVIGLSGTPKFVAADDFNRDGLTDIAVTDGSSLQLYKNTYPTTYGLQFAATISTNEQAGDVVFRDLNGDTFPDAVVGASAYNAYAYEALATSPPPVPYFSTGASALDYGGDPYPTMAAMPLGVTTGDFDGDGLIDVAVANQGTNDVTAFYNKGGTGGTYLNFTSGSSSYNPPHYPVGTAPYDIASGDFNGDGAWDLVTSVSGGHLALLMGQPKTQAFASPPPANLTPSAQTSSIVVADFNGDHKLDIAALYTTKAGVAVFFGN
jgi:hypothetical protein